MAKISTGKTKKRKPRDKARQGHLPGLEPPSIKEIDEQAELYVEYRNERMEAQTKELAEQDVLLELMQKHGLTTYDYDGKIVSIDELRKVKVRKKKELKEE